MTFVIQKERAIMERYVQGFVRLSVQMMKSNARVPMTQQQDARSHQHVCQSKLIIMANNVLTKSVHLHVK